MAADLALKTLREAIRKQTFAPAYYICGEDDFQKEDGVRQLVAAAIEPAMRDFNTDLRRGSEFDARSLDAALTALPMLADRRVVVIREAGSLKKDARKVLDGYLRNPAPDVLVIVVESSGGKTDKGLAASCTVLEFDLLSPARVPRWISHHATTQFGTSITPEACDLLQLATGADLYHLVSELDKLASYTGGKEIQESDVSAVVGIRRGETVADFLDVIAQRNASAALELIPHVLAQPKTSAVTIVMMLGVQTIAIAWGRARREEGVSAGRLQGEYFNLLKQSGSLFVGRPWGSAAAAWASAVDRWTSSSLERASEALLDADIALKDTRVSTDEQIIATLVLAMCTGEERNTHGIAA